MPASVYVPSHREALPLEGEGTGLPRPVAGSKTTVVGEEGEVDDEDDSSLRTVDALLRQRARRHPDAHAISYPSSGINFVDYTMQDLDVFAWRVAKHYEATGSIPRRTSSREKPSVVALLGPSNLEYLITMLALTKLGHTVLLLSTRIPQAAVENLLARTGGRVLIYEARFAELAYRVGKEMPVQLLELAVRSVFEFPVDVRGDTRLDHQLDPEVEKDSIVFIIHSSGSTGLPKPIYQTQISCLHNYANNMAMRAFITLPLFHNHGICNFFRAVHSCRPIYWYNADLPLRQDYIAQTLREHRFEIFYGVPYALKLLSESEEGIRILAQLKVVMYGGSACPDELGDALVEKGVNLVGHYGATEVGQLMTSFRPKGDKAWNYVREHDRLIPYLGWIPRGPNLYECTVTEGWPAKVQSNQPDGSYHTKDLFEPHPTIPRAWKYIARLDDTLVLVNGEKFGPVGMEGRIRSDRNVAEAVVFGDGRPYLGILVVPAASLAGRPQEEMLEAVWPVIKSANESVDAFARISKGMVRLLPIDCAYPRTDKGSIIRQAFYKAFQSEIDEAYDAQDMGGDGVRKFDVAELRQLLRGILAETLQMSATEVEDDADFALLGLDSLQALQIRSLILRSVDLGGGGAKLGQNVVFEQPSIDRLSRFLHGISSGEEKASLPSESASIEDEMQGMIEKYDIAAVNKPPTRDNAVVLVTGATGSLGAHVVARLSSDPGVATIYCLVRAEDSASALRRVKESLIRRRIYHSLAPSSRRKIVALPSDLSQPRLGLPDDAYETVSRDLRSVIHCAWSVNFNMQLSSFEKGNVAGVSHLLALCRSTPGGRASMNFCSSVSTCTRATTNPVPEAAPDLSWAQGMGYAQSKSVAEHLCARAGAFGSMTTRVLRVGQIVGDTQYGVWNAQEAVPMMMQTAVTVGALPRLPETPSWLPVDTVAAAVVDISLSNSPSLFANVTHPKSFSFVNDLLPALRSAGLAFDVVEPREWIRRLRASNPDPMVNPPIKLVDFFASKYDKDIEDFATSKVFATDVACAHSPALAGAAPVLAPAFVKKFVDYLLQNAWRPEGVSEAATKTAVLVTGSDGTRQSIVGRTVSAWLQSPFVDGDALHTKEAAGKLRLGQALSDKECQSWLNRLASRATEALEDLSYPSVTLSCSALGHSHRSQLRQILLATQGLGVVFIHLQAEVDIEAVDSAETDVLPVDGSTDEHSLMEEVKWLLGTSGISPA